MDYFELGSTLASYNENVELPADEYPQACTQFMAYGPLYEGPVTRTFAVVCGLTVNL